MASHQFLAVTTTTDEITGETKPLFGFPIALVKATDDKEPSFDLAGPSGAPRKQQYVDSATGELLANGDTLKGVRVGGEFREINAAAIEEITKATKIDTMVALGTVDLDEVPFERVTGLHYVQSPAKAGSPKAYRLVYEALLGQKKGNKVIAKPRAIVTKRTPRSRQRLSVIYADAQRQCLMLVDLHFASTVREPDEQTLVPLLTTVEQAQIDKARQVLDKLGDGALALADERDDLIDLRQTLIEQALAGEAITAPTPVAESAVASDVEAALEASLAVL